MKDGFGRQINRYFNLSIISYQLFKVSRCTRFSLVKWRFTHLSLDSELNKLKVLIQIICHIRFIRKVVGVFTYNDNIVSFPLVPDNQLFAFFKQHFLMLPSSTLHMPNTKSLIILRNLRENKIFKIKVKKNKPDL